VVRHILFDRMYGRFQFPPVIRKLLDCPGLLRLREVHMSSIPFMAFPSFSSVNRFEHALGVCHLAQLASDALQIPLREKIELMCACLYHDVATPPFAHVTEELMHAAFGFDHETHLRNLLVGNTEDLGMEKIQIYKGKGLKLPKVIHDEEGRRLDLDIFRIADMATGKGELGPLVKGELDLDNIDNVIRAATAMGIRIAGSHDAEALARSFHLSRGGLSLHEDSIVYMRKWQQTRHVLYDMIYGDVEDFSLQTMLKLAIRLLIDAHDEKRILPFDWRLTDEELIGDRIMWNDDAKRIWKSILLFKPYPCIGIFSVSGPNSYSYLENNVQEIEAICTSHFKTSCTVNMTVDKRSRQLTYPLRAFSGVKKKQSIQPKTENTFLFIFSPKAVKQQHKHYLEFVPILQKILPSNIDLRTVNRIVDKYPRLVEEGDTSEVNGEQFQHSSTG
jgi:HD superfamily phosphohydrolase